VTVMVSNPSTPSFTASFSYPATGATVSGAPSVGMTTTADWGKTKTFTLSVDGTVLTSQTFATGSTRWYTWATTKIQNGAHTLTGTTLWYTWDTSQVKNGPHTLTLTVSMNGQTASTTLSVKVKR